MSNSMTFSVNSRTLNAQKYTSIFLMKAAPQWTDIEITQTL